MFVTGPVLSLLIIEIIFSPIGAYSTETIIEDVTLQVGGRQTRSSRKKLNVKEDGTLSISLV